MAINRKITCKNDNGYEVTFSEGGFSPFVLVDAEGVYTVSNNVSIVDNTITDGGEYLGSVQATRNIVLTVTDVGNYAENRDLLDSVFLGKSAGTLIYDDGTNKRKCRYYVEGMESTGANPSRTHTISLICNDPYFYAMDDIVVYMANYVGGFEFQHMFLEEGEEIGTRSQSKLQNIINQAADDNIGMEIAIEATGDVTNPKITRVESGEFIAIGDSSYPLTMEYGDVLTITTGINDKHIYLEHGGETTEINRYMTEDSVFIQLMRGENHIAYSADSGDDNMSVSITYKMRYMRV